VLVCQVKTWTEVESVREKKIDKRRRKERE
jgi:hypothetical protein